MYLTLGSRTQIMVGRWWLGLGWYRWQTEPFATLLRGSLLLGFLEIRVFR